MKECVNIYSLLLLGFSDNKQSSTSVSTICFLQTVLRIRMRQLPTLFLNKLYRLHVISLMRYNHSVSFTNPNSVDDLSTSRFSSGRCVKSLQGFGGVLLVIARLVEDEDVLIAKEWRYITQWIWLAVDIRTVFLYCSLDVIFGRRNRQVCMIFMLCTFCILNCSIEVEWCVAL